MKNLKTTGCVALLLLLAQSGAVWAQQSDKLKKEVKVTRPYEATIMDAKKLNLLPFPNDSVKGIDADFDYSLTAKPISPGSSLTQIAAATPSLADLPKSNLGYVRLGAGYKPAVLGDFYLNNAFTSNLNFGIFANHRSFFGKVPVPSPPTGGDRKTSAKEMKNIFGLFLNSEFNEHRLSVNADYSWHQVLFYGRDSRLVQLYPTGFDSDSVKQVYDSFGLNVAFSSAHPDANALNYGVDFTYRYFGDNSKKQFDYRRSYQMQENLVGALVRVEKGFYDNQSVGVNLSFQNIKKQLKANSAQPILQDSSYNNTTILLNPTYTYTADEFKLVAGLDFVIDWQDGANTNLYPNISFTYTPVEAFNPYVEAKGRTQINSYERIANENPYIYPGMNMFMENTVMPFIFNLGIKGSADKVFSYNLYFSYQQADNLYYYVNSDHPAVRLGRLNVTDNNNNFFAIYDKTNILKVSAEMMLSLPKFEAIAKAEYSDYKPKNLDEAYHRPSFTADFSATFKPDQNWSFIARAYGRGKSKVYMNDPLKSYVDFSLGAEYNFVKWFSVFVSVNNILNRKYELWNGYPVQGINAMGGITIRF